MNIKEYKELCTVYNDLTKTPGVDSLSGIHQATNPCFGFVFKKNQYYIMWDPEDKLLIWEDDDTELKCAIDAEEMIEILHNNLFD